MTMPKGWKQERPANMTKPKRPKERDKNRGTKSNEVKKWRIDALIYNISTYYDGCELERRRFEIYFDKLKAEANQTPKSILGAVAFVATLTLGIYSTGLKLPLAEILIADFLVGVLLYSYMIYYSRKLGEGFYKIERAYYMLLGGITFVKEIIGAVYTKLDDVNVEDISLIDAYLRLASNGRFAIIDAHKDMLDSKIMGYYHKYNQAQIDISNKVIRLGLEVYELERTGLRNNELINVFDERYANITNESLLKRYEELYTLKNNEKPNSD